MTTKKVVSFFSGKIGVTPSVAAPGDTNPSDATVIAKDAVYWNLQVTIKVSNKRCV